MKRTARWNRLVGALARGGGVAVALALLLAPAGARGGTFFRRADPGPIVSSVQRIVAFGSRTLAFEETGTYLLEGKGWVPFPTVVGDARLTYLPGAEDVFSGGDRLYGLTLASSGGTLLSRLSPSGVWEVVAELDAPAGRSGESASGSRLYGASRGRFVSISLEDGTEREEPPLPARGRFFALEGTPILVADTDAPEKPVYRLDAGAWSLLTSWRADARHLSSSGRALFSLESPFEVRRLTAVGSQASLSGEFPGASRSDPACLACDGVAFRELGEETFTISSRTSVVQRLAGESFVPLVPPAPFARVRRLDPVGCRLFAVALDDSLYALDGGWSEVPSPGGRPGAQRYVQGKSELHAIAGGIWRRDASGWTKLPPPFGLPVGAFGSLYGERPLAQVLVDGARRLLAFSRADGVWEDLELPPPFSTDEPWGALPVFGHRDAVFVVSASGALARLSGGAWTTLVPDRPDRFARVVETEGETYALCWERAYRVEDGALLPAFPELSGRFRVGDVLKVAGVSYLVGTWLAGLDPESAKPALLAFTDGSFTPILDERDGVDPFGTLSRVGDGVGVGREFPGRFLLYGADGLREARAETRDLSGIDREGRFAWGGDGTRRSLLSPVPRVRKTIPAIVDAVGVGGARYRSSLLLANLSGRGTTARLVAGDAGSEVALGPNEERWIEDPVPGYVGPLAVTFEGALGDADAVALARVHSPSGGGRAGTSLVGVDAGSFTGQGVLLPPVPRSGDRLHLALANAGDGPGTPLSVFARPPEAGVPDWWIPGQLLPGRLWQQDALPPSTGATRLEASGTPWRADDLLGYVVRNDALTNDGVVVPFEPPDPLPARGVRFLPAVVSLSTDRARYVTELSLARRRYTLVDDELRTRVYRVRYRPAAPGAAGGTFDVGLRLADVLRVPDVGPWLVSNGVPVDPEAVDGTLTFTCDEDVGAADLVVTAVVNAVTASGTYGVSVPVLNEGAWAASRAVVPGLLENAETRSNLALASPEPEGGPDVTLSVSLHRGLDGAPIGSLPPVTLRPGQRYQVRPLAAIGYGDGTAFALIERTGGSGRFAAYGVLVDAATNDGTLLPMCVR